MAWNQDPIRRRIPGKVDIWARVEHPAREARDRDLKGVLEAGWDQAVLGQEAAVWGQAAPGREEAAAGCRGGIGPHSTEC